VADVLENQLSVGSTVGPRQSSPLVKEGNAATVNPFQFLQEVRQEAAKVTWPTWKEVWITTVMVLIMVTMAAIFFLIIDQILGGVVNMVLRLGR